MMTMMLMMVDTNGLSEQLVYESQRSFVLHGPTDGGSFVLHAPSQPGVLHMAPCLTAAPTHRNPVEARSMHRRHASRL